MDEHRAGHKFTAREGVHAGHALIRDQRLHGSGEVDQWLCITCGHFLPRAEFPQIVVVLLPESSGLPERTNKDTERGTQRDAPEKRPPFRLWWEWGPA